MSLNGIINAWFWGSWLLSLSSIHPKMTNCFSSQITHKVLTVGAHFLKVVFSLQVWRSLRTWRPGVSFLVNCTTPAQPFTLGLAELKWFVLFLRGECWSTLVLLVTGVNTRLWERCVCPSTRLWGDELFLSTLNSLENSFSFLRFFERPFVSPWTCLKARA